MSQIPIRRTKPSNAIQDFLRSQIFSGKLRPGQWIRIEDLATMHGVSTTPVREAVAVLIDEGLLEARPRRGVTINPFTVQDILDTFELYASISALLVERSVHRLEDAQIEQIKEILYKMSDVTRDLENQISDGSRERRELDQLNWEFHRLIHSSCDSVYLKNIARYIARNFPRDFYMRTDDWPNIAQKQHEELYNALIRRDAAAARAIAERHILSDGEMLVRYLTREGLFDANRQDRSKQLGA